MKTVPDLMQRIAGKSIPLEVCLRFGSRPHPKLPASDMVLMTKSPFLFFFDPTPEIRRQEGQEIRGPGRSFGLPRRRIGLRPQLSRHGAPFRTLRESPGRRLDDIVGAARRQGSKVVGQEWG
jgi:hypothetical protein